MDLRFHCDSYSHTQMTAWLLLHANMSQCWEFKIVLYAASDTTAAEDIECNTY